MVFNKELGNLSNDIFGGEIIKPTKMGIELNGKVIEKYSNECADKSTEYFNGVEWKKISEYTEEEEILQYNISTGRASLGTLSRNTEILKNTILSKDHRVITTFYYTGEGINLTDDKIRLGIANIMNGEKEFDKNWYKCNKHQIKIVTDEIIKHDINRQEHYNKLYHTVYINSKHGVDFMQFACACCGLRAIIKENKKHGYELFITYRTNPTLEEFIDDIGVIDEDKYSFTTPTSALVLRKEGNIFLKKIYEKENCNSTNY